jgi:branched-chain amino acid aminotransferase
MAKPGVHTDPASAAMIAGGRAAVASSGAGGSALADGAAFVDGEIVPIAQARIPITDTGFLRSDATYDVVAVWKGSFFRLQDHLDRFSRGCEELRLRLPLERQAIADLLHELIRRSALRDAYVEVICTRGIADRGKRDPRQFKNRFYAYAIPYVWLLPAEENETGMNAVVARSVRRIPDSSVDQRVKNFMWGDLTRGLYEAYDRGARYPILLDAQDNVAEGAGYNVFAVVEGRLMTPAAGVLEGITRRTVLELAAERGMPATVGPLPANLLYGASEMFATSTAGGVMPITRLDDEPVGTGLVGPVTRELRENYWAAHDDPRYATPVDYDAG